MKNNIVRNRLLVHTIDELPVVVSPQAQGHRLHESTQLQIIFARLGRCRELREAVHLRRDRSRVNCNALVKLVVLSTRSHDLH